MRSITLTLLVDLVRRGWLVLPASALLMFALPAGVFSALRQEGSLEVDDPAQVWELVRDPRASGMAMEQLDRDRDGSLEPDELCGYQGEGAVGEILSGFVRDVCETMMLSEGVDGRDR